MPYFDRFDIAEAWYLALCDCHGGQWSREYARLCKLGRSFKPSPSLSVETLSENAREIYDNACARMLNTRKVRIGA
jgi:hypothetical protein